MRNVSEKICTEYKNTHFAFSKYFLSKIVPFMRKCERKNIVEPGRSQIAIQQGPCTLLLNT